MALRGSLHSYTGLHSPFCRSTQLCGNGLYSRLCGYPLMQVTMARSMQLWDPLCGSMCLHGQLCKYPQSVLQVYAVTWVFTTHSAGLHGCWVTWLHNPPHSASLCGYTATSAGLCDYSANSMHLHSLLCVCTGLQSSFCRSMQLHGSLQPDLWI